MIKSNTRMYNSKNDTFIFFGICCFSFPYLILEHMAEELISGTRRKEAKLIFTLE